MNDKQTHDPNLHDTSQMPEPEEQLSAHGPQDTEYERPAQPYEYNVAPYGQTPKMSPAEREGGPQQGMEPPVGGGLILQRASTLLRIGGWIKIVMGVFTILSSLLLLFMRNRIPAFFMTSDMTSALDMIEGMHVGSILGALAAIAAVNGALSLWFGIAAVKHHRDNQKITFLYVVGIILLVVSILGIFGGFTWTTLVNLIAAICYFLGARNKKAHYAVL